MPRASTQAQAESASDGASKLQGLVIFAKDVTRISDFYAAVLKLELIESEKSHRVLANETLELVIHGISKAVAKNIEIDVPPKQRASTALKPMFRVQSLTELRSRIESHSGTLKPLKNAWLIRGDRVLDGCDPEGNVLQFRECET